ncbi:MAG: hypothetical protein R3281_08050 [Balneolaceae bacterium]|nr:hypothetical protein [Balneolaceae bacterium]
MNKNEPKKSPARDFFAWLHFATAKRSPDITAVISTLLIKVFHLLGPSQYLLQDFFLYACAAFARGGSEIARPEEYEPKFSGSPKSRKSLHLIPVKPLCVDKQVLGWNLRETNIWDFMVNFLVRFIFTEKMNNPCLSIITYVVPLRHNIAIIGPQKCTVFGQIKKIAYR